MIVTTFQAVSGAGVKGIQEFRKSIKRILTAPCNAFPYPIAYNLIPQIGDFDDLGISKEEWKLQNESRKSYTMTTFGKLHLRSCSNLTKPF